MNIECFYNINVDSFHRNPEEKSEDWSKKKPVCHIVDTILYPPWFVDPTNPIKFYIQSFILKNYTHYTTYVELPG